MKHSEFAKHMMSTILVHNPGKALYQFFEYDDEDNICLCATACGIATAEELSELRELAFTSLDEYEKDERYTGILFCQIVYLNDKSNFSLEEIANEVSSWDNLSYRQIEERVSAIVSAIVSAK